MNGDKPVKVEVSRPVPEAGENALGPVVDIYERESEVVLVAEVPGASKDSISIQVDKGVLTLQATPKPLAPSEEFNATYVGFGAGPYYRAFALSDEIDRGRIHATVVNGVLTVHLPKAETARPRKIEIKVAQ